jgi:hypothetical protein
MCAFYRRSTPIDIMIIPDEIPLEKIVTNFDLTFCQVWWDGEKLHSNDIEDVYSKKGSLNKDYIKSYLLMNEFIINRISKYKKRGFKISIDMTDFNSTDLLVDIDAQSNKKSISTCEEQWVFTKICDYAYKMLNFQYKSFLFFDFYPKEFTMESLINMYTKNVFFALVKRYYFECCVYFEKKYKDAFIGLFGKIDEENFNYETNESIIRIFIDRKFSRLQDIMTPIRGVLFRHQGHQDQYEGIPQMVVNGNLFVNGNLVVNGDMVVGNPQQNNQ